MCFLWKKTRANKNQINQSFANFSESLKIPADCFHTTRFCLPGDEHGDVLADDKLLSTSSGSSTEAVRKLLKLRL